MVAYSILVSAPGLGGLRLGLDNKYLTFLDNKIQIDGAYIVYSYVIIVIMKCRQTVKAKEAVRCCASPCNAMRIFLLLSSSVFSCFGSMSLLRSDNMLAFDERPRMTVRRFLTF